MSGQSTPINGNINQMVRQKTITATDSDTFDKAVNELHGQGWKVAQMQTQIEHVDNAFKVFYLAIVVKQGL